MIGVKHLKKWYPLHAGPLTTWTRWQRKFVRAVDDITLSITGGETLGLVGVRGSGKTTNGELLVRLQDLTDGVILVRGE